MSKRSLILIVLLAILCAAVIIRFAVMPADSGETAPGADQIMPRESEAASLPENNAPAQPGEGPDGLPTPTV